MTITRAGKPVAEPHPLAQPPLTAAALLSRRKHLLPVGPGELRASIDAVIDLSLRQPRYGLLDTSTVVLLTRLTDPMVLPQ